VAGRLDLGLAGLVLRPAAQARSLSCPSAGPVAHRLVPRGAVRRAHGTQYRDGAGHAGVRDAAGAAHHRRVLRDWPQLERAALAALRLAAAAARRGPARARSHCRFVPLLIHFIPDSLS
jgi:hypothetical protein